MENSHKSSSFEQVQAEKEMFKRVKEVLHVDLANNAKIFLSSDGATYIQPDFYSEEHSIVGEIFAHIGKPKKAQDNKIANDILKMLLLEKVKGRKYRKIITVCDKEEKEKLEGKSALALSIKVFGIDVMMINIDDVTRENLLLAQERQKMMNAE